ncbi:hypothetical protein ALC60_02477, partial [Trachymyrmex zeteki]
ILYEGIATKLAPRKNQTAPIIYTVTTQDTTFALTKTGDVDIYKLAQTEHPKLFILETQKGRTFNTKTKVAIENLDIFLYVNSKFIYVEKHIKTQLTQLYRDIMEQKCALERQVLQNALTLASIAPDEMAYRITREPGYTAIATGEVIHLVKCIPVEVKLRHVEQCYQELPIVHGNTSLFLTPRSRIITRTGTQRDCSDLLPTMYKIHGAWFRITPKPIEVLAPPIIQPLTKPKWHYVSPTSLATSGIYNPNDIDRLRSHIMFPVEKPSMLNTLARGALGGAIQPGTVSLSTPLDEDSINRIAESAGAKLWAGFIIRIASAEVDRIQQNTTNLRSITLAGSASVDGRCTGAQYTDGYGTWENVLVQATVRITLNSIDAPIKRSTRQVILPSGTRCSLTPGYCMDSNGAESYWPPLPIDHCHFDQYNILYEGLATKLSSKKNQSTPTIYTVTTQDTTFALTKTSDIDVCGYKLAQTEHPKLFILETQKGRTFNSRTKVAVENLDIFLYVNSKFIYVEKHIKTTHAIIPRHHGTEVRA